MGQPNTPSGSSILDAINVGYENNVRTLHHHQQVGGDYVFLGGCDVLYAAHCRQCGGFLAFSTDAERLRWIGIHQGPGHTCEAALVVRTP